MTAQEYRDQYYANWNHHYTPQNEIVVARGEGTYLWDVDGNKYMDCLMGIGAVNQGHSHPVILKAFADQASKITLTSRAFHNTQLGEFGKYITELTGYDKFIPMNTGVEADETAIKFARRWAYRTKGTPDDHAMVLFPRQNFWGRSICARGTSDWPGMHADFGPWNPGFDQYEWNDVAALEAKLQEQPHTCAVLTEPLQGEGGFRFCDDGYLQKVRELCTKYNALFICDEIQTGMGRTGKLFAHHYEDVRPDMVVMGKSISGGLVPVSGVVADDMIMKHIVPGDHGCTYGGNPLAMAVAHAAVRVLHDEGMIENAAKMGPIMHKELCRIDSPLIKEVRSRGLFVGIELHKEEQGVKVDGDHAIRQFFLNNLLTAKARKYAVRLLPALTINESHISEICEKVEKSFKELEKINETL